MKLHLTVVALFTILISCKKNGAYPAQLVATKYELTSLPKVYCKFGEVTDKSIVENYVKSWAGSYFSFNIDTTIQFPPDTIVFEERDRVVFPAGSLVDKRVVRSIGQYLFFYMSDTITLLKRPDNVLYAITDKIGIVKPFRKDACPYYIGANGSCNYEQVYDAYIATGSSSRLEFPMMAYKITRRQTGYATGVASSAYNNVFDPTVLNLLQDGDTIAIQNARRTYERAN